MAEKQTRTDVEPGKAESQPARRVQPGAKGAGRNADARGDSGKLRDNQSQLGVDAEHKTPEMKKGHRGTFP